MAASPVRVTFAYVHTEKFSSGTLSKIYNIHNVFLCDKKIRMTLIEHIYCVSVKKIFLLGSKLTDSLLDGVSQIHVYMNSSSG